MKQKQICHLVSTYPRQFRCRFWGAIRTLRYNWGGNSTSTDFLSDVLSNNATSCFASEHSRTSASRSFTATSARGCRDHSSCSYSSKIGLLMNGFLLESQMCLWRIFLKKFPLKDQETLIVSKCAERLECSPDLMVCPSPAFLYRKYSFCIDWDICPNRIEVAVLHLEKLRRWQYDAHVCTNRKPVPERRIAYR